MDQTKQTNRYRKAASLAVSWLVGLFGLYTVLATLLSQFNVRRGFRYTNSLQIDVHLLLGLGLVYLSVLLSRGKRSAWVIACGISAFMLGEGTDLLLSSHPSIHPSLVLLMRSVLLPLIVLVILVLSRKINDCFLSDQLQIIAQLFVNIYRVGCDMDQRWRPVIGIAVIGKLLQ